MSSGASSEAIAATVRAVWGAALSRVLFRQRVSRELPLALQRTRTSRSHRLRFTHNSRLLALFTCFSALSENTWGTYPQYAQQELLYIEHLEECVSGERHGFRRPLILWARHIALLADIHRLYLVARAQCAADLPPRWAALPTVAWLKIRLFPWREGDNPFLALEEVHAAQ